MRLKYALSVLFLSFICFYSFHSFLFAQETLTITTYYPSPYGSYKELRSTRMAIGDNYIKVGDYDWGDEIDNNADLVVEGNVGIGTTTPGYTLHLKSGTNPVLNLENPTAGSWIRIDPGNAGSENWLLGANDAGAGIYSETDSAWRLLVNNSGNVGIGVDSPTQKLDINGQVRIRGGAPAVGRVLTSDANGNATWQVPSGGASWPNGSYCILANGACPAGFTASTLNLLVGLNAHDHCEGAPRFSGSSSCVTAWGSYVSRQTLNFCCK